ncbi:MAG: class I SAM-dependent methyltransferase [Desulfuromonadaceae bacterium]
MNIDTTAPIIKQLEDAVQAIPGWSPVDQLYSLFNLVYMTSGLEGDIIEIGSWCGRSAVALGMAAQLTGGTKIHCIDLFPAKDDWRENPDGSFSLEVTIDGRTFGGYQEQTVWREPYLKDIAPLYENYASIYDIFCQSIKSNGLESLVSTYRGDSSTFMSSITDNFKCRVAFIDGDHSYDAVCDDIHNIERFLISGGWVCLDDAFSHYDGINRAINDCIISSGKYELCQQMTRKFFVARKK